MKIRNNINGTNLKDYPLILSQRFEKLCKRYIYYIAQIMKSTQHVIKNAHRPTQIQYMYHLYMGERK